MNLGNLCIGINYILFALCSGIAVLFWTLSGDFVKDSAEIVWVVEPAESGDMINFEVGIFKIERRLLNADVIEIFNGSFAGKLLELAK